MDNNDRSKDDSENDSMWEEISDNEEDNKRNNDDSYDEQEETHETSSESISENLGDIDNSEFINNSTQQARKDKDTQTTPSPTEEKERDRGGNSGRVNWEDRSDDQNTSNTRGDTVEDNNDSDEEKKDNLGHIDGQDYTKPPVSSQSFISNLSWPGEEKFNTNEELIRAENPSVVSNIYNWLLGGAAIIGGSILLIHWLITGYSGPLRQTTTIFGAEFETLNLYIVQICLIIIVAVIQLLYFYIQRKYVWYIVTDQRAWVREGVFFQTQTNINHEDITNISEINPVPERFFGVGTIQLFTAGTDVSELSLNYTRNPNEWINIIRSQTQE